MEDKRIQKTRQKLQQALTALLAETPFERLNVTELCVRAGVSRITFYANYADKYALVQERLDTLQQAAADAFSRRQEITNPSGEPAASCRNLLDAYLEAQSEESALLSSAALENNAYLAFAYYASIVRGAEMLGAPYLAQLRPRYPAAMVADMLCMGLWGFARTALCEGVSPDELCAQMHSLLEGQLRGELFRT